MAKINPNVSIDPEIWERYKESVDNASRELQRAMERRIDPEQDSIGEIENRMRAIEDKMAELGAEKAALQQKKEKIEQGKEPNGWVCLNCGKKGKGEPEDIDVCPECYKDRIGEQED